MNSTSPRQRVVPKRTEKKTEANAKSKINYGRNVHKLEESLLTSTSGFDHYRGILNLCIVLMALSNCRVALDNILKYGVLIDPVQVVTFFLEDPYRWPSASLVMGSNVFIQFCFLVEHLLAKGRVSESVGNVLHSCNLLLVLALPCTVILTYQPVPWAAGTACMVYSCVWMKLISYICVNKWNRLGYIKSEQTDGKSNMVLRSSKDNVANGKTETKELVKYPDNLNQKDLYYFVFAPTLCYELNFPRTPRIRKRFLIRRVVEFCFLVGLLIAAMQQWIVPTVSNSMKPLQEMAIGRALERIMKLAVPNHVMWLLFFYAYFHSFLNIVGEFLRFGDRTFYKDWWNSPTVQYFWQNWNIPVHRWCLRHLYLPMLNSGYSRLQAQIAVFLLSAFFHEFLISVPLRMAKLWAFSAMLAQVPLHLFIRATCGGNPNYGNIVVWLSIILGQPLAIMMYFHDYYVSSLSE